VDIPQWRDEQNEQERRMDASPGKGSLYTIAAHFMPPFQGWLWLLRLSLGQICNFVPVPLKT
jgi:hypothetical protein